MAQDSDKVGVTRQIAALLLKLVLFGVLFLGSCAASFLTYYHSPKWALKAIDTPGKQGFFVAFEARDKHGDHEIHVENLSYDPAQAGLTEVRYQFADEPRTRYWSGGEERAEISIATLDDQSQLIRVFVSGETLWSSISEYVVKDDTVYPQRYGHAVPWVLYGALLGPLLIVLLFRRSLSHAVNRTMGVDADKP